MASAQLPRVVSGYHIGNMNIGRFHCDGKFYCTGHLFLITTEENATNLVVKTRQMLFRSFPRSGAHVHLVGLLLRSPQADINV